MNSKDGDFFISDWLRNRNTVEFLGIWEQIHNPDFNYGEFAIIRSSAGLNSYKISVKEWVQKINAIGLQAIHGIFSYSVCLDHMVTSHLLDHLDLMCWTFLIRQQINT